MHDILTGSTRDGRAIAGSEDSTCSNWTTSGAGAAMVGHHDRQGLRDDDASKSWNSSHLSRPTKEGAPGCSQAALQGTGGNGLFYCFVAN
jgi:formate-dependent phosphoribosylglycinamide formyltransferase (GAR transformylase)